MKMIRSGRWREISKIVTGFGLRVSGCRGGEEKEGGGEEMRDTGCKVRDARCELEEG